jgi:pre-mRNA cleavage complex 2 protein Pcf11
MRFPATEAGKKAKGNHIDWHFKTNSRVADSMKSAVNRSWYLDERVSFPRVSTPQGTH